MTSEVKLLLVFIYIFLKMEIYDFRKSRWNVG